MAMQNSIPSSPEWEPYDTVADIEAMVAGFEAAGLEYDVNIVRYNPTMVGLGADPGDDVVEHLADAYRGLLPGDVKVVERVGHDVYANCGMFAAV